MIMIFITWALQRYQLEDMLAEEFSTDSRSVKTGLILFCFGGVFVTLSCHSCKPPSRHWSFGASLVRYWRDRSGMYCTVQYIILLATLVIEHPRRAPGVHTYLEVVASIPVTVKDLTGMNVITACILPLGVIVHSVSKHQGHRNHGLPAHNHIDDHDPALRFTIYANHDVLGSPSQSTICW